MSEVEANAPTLRFNIGEMTEPKIRGIKRNIRPIQSANTCLNCYVSASGPGAEGLKIKRLGPKPKTHP